MDINFFDDHNTIELDKEDNIQFHHLARKKRKPGYCDNTIKQIQTVYIIAAILWIMVIYCLGLKISNVIVLTFLSAPLIVFAINYISAEHCNEQLEGIMFQANFLYFAFIIAILVINWNGGLGGDKGVYDKRPFFKIIIVAFILLMFSMVDIWVRYDKQVILKHIKTCLQTSSIFLLAYVLYSYYLDHCERDYTSSSNISINNT